MIVFITVHGHGYCVDGLKKFPFDPEGIPIVSDVSYERLFRLEELPRATYVFVDVERLYPWERGLAAECFRSMKAAGLRCLNDPARILTRYPLLRTLAAEGVVPYNIYRADDVPKPTRFPVFIRRESDHAEPNPHLINSQRELEHHLSRMVEAGWPLADCLVVEYVDCRNANGLWTKSSVYRVGNSYHYDHFFIKDEWIVKVYSGTAHLWTEELFQEERQKVEANEVSHEIVRAFEVSGVEYGRADFAHVSGRDVLFEINTNPRIMELPEPTSFRLETRVMARRRLAQLLGGIETASGGRVRPVPGPRLSRFRQQNSDPRRPVVRP